MIFATLLIQVANLKEELTHGIRLREALKHGLQRSPGTRPKFLGYVPTKVGIWKFKYFMSRSRACCDAWALLWSSIVQEAAGIPEHVFLIFFIS